MHVTYWNTPRRLSPDSDQWRCCYETDFWSFQISNQSDCCGGITECVWLVPETLSCE